MYCTHVHGCFIIILIPSDMHHTHTHIHTHAHTYTHMHTHAHTHTTHTHTQVSSMQPGQSEKGVASNPVLVSCMERAALVNYQELYHHFLAQKEGTVGEGRGSVTAWGGGGGSVTA